MKMPSREHIAFTIPSLTQDQQEAVYKMLLDLAGVETDLNPIFYIDFYKVGHVDQYHKDVRQIFSNITARSSRIPNVTHVTNLGLSYFIQKYLIADFNEYFFGKPLDVILSEYRRIIKATLFVENPRTDHIEALWRKQYLPLTIYALPEGAQVPLGAPLLVVKNTDPGEFYWLPNYIESLMSSILWKPLTSATMARQYRALFLKHARRAGETNFDFVNWQGHDFSFRGMSGIEDAKLSGLGHMTMFTGTDTLPAVLFAEKYYGAKLEPTSPIVGGSIPATEHSVMCAGLQDGEYETFERLLFEVYKSGPVSVVSDTWDLWRVLTDYIPRMRSKLDARDGKLVVRPDSGDPVKIMCGDPDAAHGNPAASGVLRLLAQAMGTFDRGSALPLIGKPHQYFMNTGASIYGDSISLPRADQILTRCIDEIRLSPYNCVFGIGSFTYEYTTRDTYGIAMKATAYKNAAGEIIPMFKKPITDDGGKFSHHGIPVVDYNNGTGDYETEQDSEEWELDKCSFLRVFSDGNHLIKPTLEQIRELARRGM